MAGLVVKPRQKNTSPPGWQMRPAIPGRLSEPSCSGPGEWLRRRRRINDAKPVLRPTRSERGGLGSAEAVPLRLPHIDRDRAERLGAAIQVRHVHAEVRQPPEQRRGWRGTTRIDVHTRGKPASSSSVIMVSTVGSSAEVRDALISQQAPDLRRIHLAQAHVSAADCGHSPGEAPSTASRPRLRPSRLPDRRPRPVPGGARSSQARTEARTDRHYARPTPQGHPRVLRRRRGRRPQDRHPEARGYPGFPAADGDGRFRLGDLIDFWPTRPGKRGPGRQRRGKGKLRGRPASWISRARGWPSAIHRGMALMSAPASMHSCAPGRPCSLRRAGRDRQLAARAVAGDRSPETDPDPDSADDRATRLAVLARLLA